MKRMLFSAVLALGIHACFLWVDFDWAPGKPALKLKPRMVTLELVSRPMPKADPVSKPVRPASPPPAPEPAPAAKLKHAPKPAPETRRESVTELKAAPPQEDQTPSRYIPESGPLPDGRTHAANAAERKDAPAAVSMPEPQTRIEPKTAEPKQSVPAGPAEISTLQPVIREAKPRYRDNPSPAYPFSARIRGHQGTVILDVLIDIDGRVADIKVFSSSGYAILDKAARTTVEKWLFEPGMKDEEKIEMRVKIPIRFQLK